MNQSLADKLNPNWYSVAIINLLVLGLVMLFYKELTENIKSFLVPSLLVYTIGNALIGHIQGSFFRAKFMEEGFVEPLWFYYLLYIIWFILLLAYLFYRDVL